MRRKVVGAGDVTRTVCCSKPDSDPHGVFVLLKLLHIWKTHCSPPGGDTELVFVVGQPGLWLGDLVSAS